MTYTSILHCKQKSTFCPFKNRHETSHDPHHPDLVFTCSKLINIQASRMVRNFRLIQRCSVATAKQCHHTLADRYSLSSGVRIWYLFQRHSAVDSSKAYAIIYCWEVNGLYTLCHFLRLAVKESDCLTTLNACCFTSTLRIQVLSIAIVSYFGFRYSTCAKSHQGDLIGIWRTW